MFSLYTSETVELGIKPLHRPHWRKTFGWKCIWDALNYKAVYPLLLPPPHHWTQPVSCGENRSAHTYYRWVRQLFISEVSETRRLRSERAVVPSQGLMEIFIHLNRFCDSGRHEMNTSILSNGFSFISISLCYITSHSHSDLWTWSPLTSFFSSFAYHHGYHNCLISISCSSSSSPFSSASLSFPSPNPSFSPLLLQWDMYQFIFCSLTISFTLYTEFWPFSLPITLRPHLCYFLPNKPPTLRSCFQPAEFNYGCFHEHE